MGSVMSFIAEASFGPSQRTSWSQTWLHDSRGDAHLRSYSSTGSRNALGGATGSGIGVIASNWWTPSMEPSTP